MNYIRSGISAVVLYTNYPLATQIRLACLSAVLLEVMRKAGSVEIGDCCMCTCIVSLRSVCLDR
jgi:hypothetical protein